MPTTPEAAAPTPPDLSEFELPDSEAPPIVLPDKTPATPPATPKHSPRMLRLAAHVGLSAQEIEAATPDELEREVRAIQLEQQQLALEHRLQSTRPPSNNPATAPKAEPPLVDWGEFEDEVEGAKVKKPFKDVVHENFRKVIESQAKRLKDMEEKLGQREQTEQQKEVAAKIRLLDEGFAALGPAYEPLFGKGEGLKLPPKEGAMLRRRAVLKSLESDPPEETLTVVQAIQQRAKELYGERKAKPAPAAAADTLDYPELDDLPDEPPAAPPRRTPPKDPASGRFTREVWDDAPLPRPTQRRNSPEPAGKAKAVKHLAERMAANGQLPSYGTRPSEEDELPD